MNAFTSTKPAAKSGRKIVWVAVVTLIVNIAITALVVASGAEIIGAILGLFGAEINAGALSASSALLALGTFLFLVFFEAVLVFIGWIWYSIIKEM